MLNFGRMNSERSWKACIGIGIVALVGAILCFAFPSAPIVVTGWFVTILMAIAGMAMIVGYVSERQLGNGFAAVGAANLVIGIIMAAFAVAAMFIPSLMLSLEIFLVVMFVVSLLFNGISMMIAGASVGGPEGIWSLILGTLLLATGILGITNIFGSFMAFGVFIGFGLACCGIVMIASGVQAKVGMNDDSVEAEA